MTKIKAACVQMRSRFDLLTTVLSSLLFFFLAACSKVPASACVIGDENAQMVLEAFLMDHAENLEFRKGVSGAGEISAEILKSITPEDIAKTDTFVEVEPGWHSASFRVRGVDGVEFSVLTGPNCASEVYFGPRR